MHVGVVRGRCNRQRIAYVGIEARKCGTRYVDFVISRFGKAQLASWCMVCGVCTSGTVSVNAAMVVVVVVVAAVVAVAWVIVVFVVVVLVVVIEVAVVAVVVVIVVIRNVVVVIVVDCCWRYRMVPMGKRKEPVWEVRDGWSRWRT